MGSLNHRSGFSIFFVPFFFFFWVKFQLFANVTTYDLIGSSFFILIYIVLRHFPSNGSGRQHKDNLSYSFLFICLLIYLLGGHENQPITPISWESFYHATSSSSFFLKKNTIVNIMFIYYNNPKQLS